MVPDHVNSDSEQIFQELLQADNLKHLWWHIYKYIYVAVRSIVATRH